MKLVYAKLVVQCECGQLIETEDTGETFRSAVLVMCPSCLGTGSIDLLSKDKPQLAFGPGVRSLTTDPTTTTLEYRVPADHHVYTKHLQTVLARSTPTLEDFATIRKAFSED